jgi:hypothetical protein
MANAPTEKEVEKIIAKATIQDEKKIASQALQGKEFVNHGQGVIPESVWKNLPGKKLDDDEAIA